MCIRDRRDNGVRAFITVTVNGQTVLFDQDPLLIGGRTLVPMRAILEALGAEVAWDQETQMLTAVRDTDTIMLTVGEQQGYVNGQPVQMAVSYTHLDVYKRQVYSAVFSSP